MTREILFRGYCSDDKRWVYGYYLKHEGCPEEGIEGCDAIGEPQKDLWFDWKEIDPLTLGQYSGFKDRYGAPLYDGDVVWVLDVFDKKIKREGTIRYLEKMGGWVVGLKKPTSAEINVHGGTPELRHYVRRCEKAYDVLKERTIYDDYIKGKWGCVE